jgi:hypothetical protein
MNKLTRHSRKLLERLRPKNAASECYSMAGLAILFIVITKTQAYQYFLVHCLALWGINNHSIADRVLEFIKLYALVHVLYYSLKGAWFKNSSLFSFDFLDVKKRN